LIRFHVHRYRHAHNAALHAAAMRAASPTVIARAELARNGWSSHYGCLYQLVDHESGWNPYASNPTSGAYGLGQALPGSKMSVAGGDWRTNPRTQLVWMLDFYIPDRYGTPCGAWDFWTRNHWY
jgi:hypothetical protein